MQIKLYTYAVRNSALVESLDLDINKKEKGHYFIDFTIFSELVCLYIKC